MRIHSVNTDRCCMAVVSSWCES